MPSTSDPKPKIWIHRGPDGYWKLSADSVGGRNEYGIIDSSFRLNGKKGKIIGLPKHPNFVKSADGASTVGGSGYIGHVRFISYDAAVEFLEEKHDVRVRNL